MQVLIVEDEPLIALAYKAIAEECGFEVAGTAAESSAAVRIARARRPDIAIIDLRLDDGPTGDWLARHLHAELGVRPIFVTGTPDLLTSAARSIAVGILVKPVPYDHLVAIMRAAAVAPASGRQHAVAVI